MNIFKNKQAQFFVAILLFTAIPAILLSIATGIEFYRVYFGIVGVKLALDVIFTGFYETLDGKKWTP